MSARRVLVLESQTPFVHGGAEILSRELLRALREHGYEAELVSIPFRDAPRDELLAHAAAWRLIDVTRALDRSIDAVVATKFPTYFVRHPAKVAWLVHQHRAAYELCGTPFSDFEHTERDVGLRKRLLELDTQMLRECRAWSISRGTPAQLAAGEIHTDIQRGFIRAEVVAYGALTGRGSMAACREHGEVRLEGKEYVVQDGDIINFRHAT